ncbi:MAG: PKD domain-containing protein [Rubrivivax sp.]|nr:PKD domain-containing protein [Rubrivivax sp.]
MVDTQMIGWRRDAMHAALAALCLFTAAAWAAVPPPPVAGTVNIATGAATAESSPGWGGGAAPQEMVDGAIAYEQWAHGLAFTGGQRGWSGTCGVRQAVVDFGVMRQFSAARIWHHGAEHVPAIYSLQYWNGSAWIAVGGTSRLRPDLDSAAFYPGWYAAVPTEHLFPEVQGSKVRFSYDNCQLVTGHGWIYEFEVFGQPGGGFVEEFDRPTLGAEWQVVVPSNARNGPYGPANHYSVTDAPGKLRFYLDPVTHGYGISNNYADSGIYDPGIDIIRQFTGEDWVLETKVDYQVPAWANGRTFYFTAVFGAPGPSAIGIGFGLYRDVGYSATRLYGIAGFGAELLSTVEFGQGAPDRMTFFLRIEKSGGRITLRSSRDGVAWAEAGSKDYGNALRGLEQRVVISGSCWFVPGGSYAEHDYVKLTTTASNQAPVASAGPDQKALVMRAAVLDGTGSTDADGDSLQYQWSFDSLPTGSVATIAKNTSPVASFVPDRAGTYVARLAVTDGRGGASSATTKVTAVDVSINRPPVALISGPASVGLGAGVRLDGSRSSDFEGDPLTFQWSMVTQPAGSTARLIGATTSAPSFIADVAGTYDVQLRVNDGQWNSFARHLVQAAGGACGVPPIAAAGDDTGGLVGRAIALSAANSRPADPGGRLISYRWTLVSQPPASNASILPVGDGRQAWFIGRTVGIYVVRLTVVDQCQLQASDELVIRVNQFAPVEPPCPNTRPVCDKLTDAAGNYRYVCDGRTISQTANPRESLIDGFQVFGCTAVWQYTRFDAVFTPIEHAWYSNRTHVGGAQPKRFTQLATHQGQDAIRVGRPTFPMGDFVVNGAVALWHFDDDFASMGGEGFFASCIADPASSGIWPLSGITGPRQFLRNPRVDSAGGALRLTWELCDTNGQCSAGGPKPLPNCARD